MKQITLSNTDPICVALRKAGVMLKEANRVKLYMDTLGFGERTAKRFDWFVDKMRRSGVPLETPAIAAAWLANEEFYVDDGVNDWIFAPSNCDWNGQGGGEFKIVDGKFVRVQA